MRTYKLFVNQNKLIKGESRNGFPVLFVVLTLTILLLFSCTNEEITMEKGSKTISSLSTREFSPEYIVPISYARNVALNMNEIAEYAGFGFDSSLAILSEYPMDDSLGHPLYYVFNYSSGGYLVLSADLRVEPVLSMSKMGTFTPDTIRPGIAQWFEMANRKIVFERYYNTLDSAQLSSFSLWKSIDDQLSIGGFGQCCPECPNWPSCLEPDLGCGDIEVDCDDTPCDVGLQHIVGPLLSTLWHQHCTMNDSCPEHNCNEVCPFTPCNSCDDHCPTGCIATAMAQVIRYHEPVNSFNYNYSLMPSFGNEGTPEVQRLMHDAGLSVDMFYTCDFSLGKWWRIDEALVSQFGFRTAVRENFSGFRDERILRGNLDRGLPVILQGCPDFSIECHVWVCDGYKKIVNAQCHAVYYYYMNWGWGGFDNGWYRTWKNYQSWNAYVHEIEK